MTKEEFIQLTTMLRDTWVLADRLMTSQNIERAAFEIKMMEASHWIESYYRMNTTGEITVEARLTEKAPKVSDGVEELLK